jgi:hypothetical protein
MRAHARVETQVSGGAVTHILLPVWMAVCTFRGETYRFVVNGGTGRVQGERPWSARKITVAVILGLMVAAVGSGVGLRARRQGFGM